jgi:hypothetical protein
MTTTQHQFILEPYKGSRTRHRCPGCSKPREFTRYIDTETGQHIAPHVGKCNRENKCGYHYTPRQYFLDNPTEETRAWLQSDQHLKTYTPPPPPVDYIPPRYLERTRQKMERNNFYRFLVKLFGEAEAARLADLYKLGTSKKWEDFGGLTPVFWQINKAGKICNLKLQAYNPHTGKRIKSKTRIIGKQLLPNGNLTQCFFGEHLLSAAPSAPVAIVESEKTAMIMASIKPDQVWIATGGKSGASWKTNPTVYHALTGRKVILYPDLNAFEDWEEAARNIAHICPQVSVFKELEQYATPEQIQEGDDIADFYIPALLERRSNTAQADQEAQEGFTLPPGWQWETFNFKHGTHRQLMDSDGLPASWNLCPQTDQEKQAVSIALEQLDHFLTHKFDLQL